MVVKESVVLSFWSLGRREVRTRVSDVLPFTVTLQVVCSEEVSVSRRLDGNLVLTEPSPRDTRGTLVKCPSWGK